MASSQAQPQPAQSPFKLFSRVSWNRSKKAKQGSLGEENNMYYHPELKRWVEKGKEEEAEREAAGPPPPPVMSSNSVTSGPLHKRSLSQRYVLQPNLSVSSSMASLAGSLSQTDLAGLSGLAANSFSGPPSALGSTAPSPPQSSSNLIPLGAYTSGPQSSTGLGNASNLFFVPPLPQRAASQPSGSGFFIPAPSTAEEERPAKVDGADVAACDPAAADAEVQRPGEENGADQDARAAAGDVDCSADVTANWRNGDAPTGGLEADATATQQQHAASHESSKGAEAPDGSGDAEGATAAVSSAPAAAAAANLETRGGALAVSMPPKGLHLSESFDTVLFSNDRLYESQQVETPVALKVTTDITTSSSMAESDAPSSLLPEQRQHQQPPGAREYRRLGGGAANASDGGAAISLHEGMGVTPVRPHYHAHNAGAHQKGEAAAAEMNGIGEEEMEGAGQEGVGQGLEAAAEAMANGELDGPPAAAGAAAPSGDVTEATAAAGEAAAAAETLTEGAASGGDGGGSAVYSQYYYQQYAYLYQYALGQGYGEADAVAYAQYYAAVYAQQYEAQTPEGQLGGDAAAAAVASTEQDQQLQQTDARAEAAAGGSSEAVGAAPEVVGAAAAAEAAWEVAAVAVEAEATAVVLETVEGVEDALRGQDPVYLMAAPSAEAVAAPAPLVVGGSTVRKEEAVPVVDAVVVSAAPLPADLTAAATAAAQHLQSAVTAAVAAAAAAAEQQQQTQQQLHSADGLLDAAAATAADGASAQSTAAGLAPQLLLGLGAAGAKRFTAAVASLGATVAASAPVAAALSAATAAASTAAAAALAAGGFTGLESGLSEDDFDRIMHPGDPAKLDGPLPWELPEHLRTGRKFLALCANWQLANPGQPYAPYLLLQQQEGPAQQQGQQQSPSEGASQGLAAPEEVVAAVWTGGDVALAAEGGSASAGATASAAAEQQQAAEELSSYERACRLAQFGQPAAALLSAKPTTAVAAERTTDEPQPSPRQREVQPPSADATSASPNGEVFIAAAVPSGKPALEIPQPEASQPFPAATAPLGVVLLPAADSPRDPLTPPDSARSEDPFAGAEHVPLAQQLRQPPSPLESPAAAEVRCGGVTLEQVLEQEEQERAQEEGSGDAEEAGAGAVEVSGTSAALNRLGTADAANFFEQLDEQRAQTPALAEPAEKDLVAVDAAAQDEADAVDVTAVAEEQHGAQLEEADTADPATAAAAAIDSVVHALEQLRSSAAAGDGGAVADPAAGTALLQQIQSSLAQATEALAGMGVDVTAFTSLAGIPKVTALTEWTPSTGHKRPRMDGSPATPTRAAAASTEGVATPLLPPGPPLGRPAVEDPAAAAGPGERFQQLGKRLSGASAEASGLVAAHGIAECLLAPAAQQQAVVLSLTVAPAPEVDVAAVEERARCEERAAWKARLGAVVDSEREAAALVFAAVERERDELQQRVGELERALAVVTAERDGLAQRLEAAEANCRQARAANADADAERGARAARMSEVVAERDSLAAQLAMERCEKAALAEALASSRTDTEALRAQYAERFSRLTTELEATRSSLAELQGEHDELLLCLGQESTKVEVLTGALREAGGDPDPLIEQIEAEYETMGLSGSGAAGGGQEAEVHGYQGNAEQEAADAAAGAETQQKQEEEAMAALSAAFSAGEGWEGEELVL